MTPETLNHMALGPSMPTFFFPTAIHACFLLRSENPSLLPPSHDVWLTEQPRHALMASGSTPPWLQRQKLTLSWLKVRATVKPKRIFGRLLLKQFRKFWEMCLTAEEFAVLKTGDLGNKSRSSWCNEISKGNLSCSCTVSSHNIMYLLKSG